MVSIKVKRIDEHVSRKKKKKSIHPTIPHPPFVLCVRVMMTMMIKTKTKRLVRPLFLKKHGGNEKQKLPIRLFSQRTQVPTSRVKSSSLTINQPTPRATPPYQCRTTSFRPCGSLLSLSLIICPHPKITTQQQQAPARTGHNTCPATWPPLHPHRQYCCPTSQSTLRTHLV